MKRVTMEKQILSQVIESGLSYDEDNKVITQKTQ